MADALTEAAPPTDRKKSDIRPFEKVKVPEAELIEMRRRINATKWPERETVTDESQGVPLATMRELARYWGTDYDWRKAEASSRRSSRTSSVPRSSPFGLPARPTSQGDDRDPFGHLLSRGDHSMERPQ
jgi:hypothetical protein